MNDPARISVFLVDDHPALRFGLSTLINNSPDMFLLGEATTGQEALAKLQSLAPNVAVIDCLLPDMPGAAVTQALLEAGGQTGVLALSGHNHAFYKAAMFDAGACGYLIKEQAAASIVSAIRAVAGDARLWRAEQIAEIEHWRETVQRPWRSLTEREREVALAVAHGEGNREVAEKLHVTERTVEFHMSNVLGKLEVSSRTTAVAWIKDNLVEQWADLDYHT